MKTVTFSIQKGGTGKTSISVSVAYELSKTSRVLLIDADPQGNATTWLNLDTVKSELADVLAGKADAKDAICKTSVSNLFILPTAGIGGELSKIKDTLAVQSPFLFSDKLEAIAEYFDYCIIDTSPSFTTLEKQCFIASNEVIPVLLLDNFSLDGTQIFTFNLDNLRKDYRLNGKPLFNKLILNKLNKQKTVSREMLNVFEKVYKDCNIYLIPTDPNFEKAQLTNKFIQEYAGAKSDTLQKIKEIAEAIKQE